VTAHLLQIHNLKFDISIAYEKCIYKSAGLKLHEAISRNCRFLPLEILFKGVMYLLNSKVFFPYVWSLLREIFLEFAPKLDINMQFDKYSYIVVWTQRRY
jgi:hypothetical protein